MLLQVVADAGDVGGDLDAAGQPHAGDLAQRRVRLLRGRGVDAGAHAAPLRAALERRRLGLARPCPGGPCGPAAGSWAPGLVFSFRPLVATPSVVCLLLAVRHPRSGVSSGYARPGRDVQAGFAPGRVSDFHDGWRRGACRRTHVLPGEPGHEGKEYPPCSAQVKTSPVSAMNCSSISRLPASASERPPGPLDPRITVPCWQKRTTAWPGRLFRSRRHRRRCRRWPGHGLAERPARRRDLARGDRAGTDASEAEKRREDRESPADRCGPSPAAHRQMPRQATTSDTRHEAIPARPCWPIAVPLAVGGHRREHDTVRGCRARRRPAPDADPGHDHRRRRRVTGGLVAHGRLGLGRIPRARARRGGGVQAPQTGPPS